MKYGFPVEVNFDLTLNMCLQKSAFSFTFCTSALQMPTSRLVPCVGIALSTMLTTTSSLRTALPFGNVSRAY